MSTKQANEAHDVIWGLGIGGFVVAVIAGVVALAQWPDSTVNDGNAAIAYLAFAVYTIAQVAFFVALVAVGVRLGVRSLDLTDAIARAVVSRADAAPTSTATGAVGAPPVHRRGAGTSGVQPLGPVSDQDYLDEDGR